MRMLSTKVHGVLDYLMGVILIVSPWIFNFNRGGAETAVPVILGAGVIVYSLMTNYELGLSGILSMRTHLNLDLMSGAFLAISPWVFGFSEFVYMPHVIFGVAEMCAALLTDPLPKRSADKSQHVHHSSHHRHAH
jgi:hypothetical protein